jgi:hypothetical protein
MTLNVGSRCLAAANGSFGVDDFRRVLPIRDPRAAVCGARPSLRSVAAKGRLPHPGLTYIVGTKHQTLCAGIKRGLPKEERARSVPCRRPRPKGSLSFPPTWASQREGAQTLAFGRKFGPVRKSGLAEGARGRGPPVVGVYRAPSGKGRWSDRLSHDHRFSCRVKTQLCVVIMVSCHISRRSRGQIEFLRLLS